MEEGDDLDNLGALAPPVAERWRGPTAALPPKQWSAPAAEVGAGRRWGAGRGVRPLGGGDGGAGPPAPAEMAAVAGSDRPSSQSKWPPPWLK